VPVSDLSDNELEIMEANYRRAGRTEGGKFSLREVLLERKRRKPSAFDTREVAARIVELAGCSADGFVTYGEIWKSFRPESQWEGHKNLRIMADTLGRVIYYCVKHQLPILTVLVVRGSNRKLSDQAIENIYNECRELGINVGFDPRAFVQSQIEQSRTILAAQIPADAPP
jgi:hypothetical protein